MNVHVVVASSMRGNRVPGQKSSFAARLIKATTALPICQVGKVRGPCRRRGNYHRRARKFPEKYSLPEGREVNAGVAETKQREREKEGREREREDSTRVERRKMYEGRKGCKRGGKRRARKGGRRTVGGGKQRSTPATLAATVAST